MSFWKKETTVENLQKQNVNTAAERLGVEFLEIGDNWLSARMPVDTRTVQPIGILHGGASVVLAETIGSCAASLCLDEEKFYCVGLDINANHVRAVSKGWVIGTARPFHVGRTTHVWEIRIENEAGQLICISRLTMAIVEHRPFKT